MNFLAKVSGLLRGDRQAEEIDPDLNDVVIRCALYQMSGEEGNCLMEESVMEVKDFRKKSHFYFEDDKTETIKIAADKVYEWVELDKCVHEINVVTSSDCKLFSFFLTF